MSANRDRRTAILLGASGLVGRECLKILSEEAAYSEVRVVTRRDLSVNTQDGRIRQILVDFDALTRSANALVGDDVFCAFGTTIKKARSQERFRQIDLMYPAELARIVRRNGGRHLSLVSSRGAHPHSRIFYLRTKGELEEELRGQGWPSACILRPSVIGGHREESRPAERVGQILLQFAPRAARTVPAELIARTMVRMALESRPGFHIVESSEIGVGY